MVTLPEDAPDQAYKRAWSYTSTLRALNKAPAERQRRLKKRLKGLARELVPFGAVIY